MNDATAPASEPAFSAEDRLSALFANLVIQQTNMATMLLGKVPHPESGKPVKDLEAAQLFIDHLEMLEAKTKGNLTREESHLLKQSLMSLRLAFVEAVESPGTETAPATQPSAAKEPSSAPVPEPAPADQPEEHHKKFTKKY